MSLSPRPRVSVDGRGRNCLTMGPQSILRAFSFEETAGENNEDWPAARFALATAAALAQARDRQLPRQCGATWHPTVPTATARPATQKARCPAWPASRKTYIVEQMKAFRDGKRPATIMHQLAKGYTDQQIEADRRILLAADAGTLGDDRMNTRSTLLVATC